MKPRLATTVALTDSPQRGLFVRGQRQPSLRLVPGGRGAIAPPLGWLGAGARIPRGLVVTETTHQPETSRAGIFLSRNSVGARRIVKVVPTDRPPRRAVAERLPRFRHPRVVRTYEVFTRRGRFYEVQEHCGGGSLAARVPYPGSGRRPPAADWLADVFVPQMHQALVFLRSQGLVHRDVKPPNIVARDRGARDLALVDFDIASEGPTEATSRETLLVAGTWPYSAPETLPLIGDSSAAGGCERLTWKVDVYALGVTLVELFQGTTEVRSLGLPELVAFFREGGSVSVPEAMPARLAQLARHLVEPDPSRRWGLDEIGEWLGDRRPRRDKAVLEVSAAPPHDVLWTEGEGAHQALALATEIDRGGAP